MSKDVFAVLSKGAGEDASLRKGILTLDNARRDGTSSHQESQAEQAPRIPTLGDFTDIFAYLVQQKQKYIASLNGSHTHTYEAPHAIPNQISDPAAAESQIDAITSSSDLHVNVPELKDKTLHTQNHDASTPPRSTRKKSKVKAHDFAIDDPEPVAVPYKRFSKTADRSKSLLDKLARRFPSEAAKFELSSKTSIWAPARPRRKSAVPIDKGDSQTYEENAETKTATEEDDTVVFVDHSNIIFGFLTKIRTNQRYKNAFPPGKKARLDYHTLFAIFERGRSVSRRVLVGSTPLHQSIEPANHWRFEVHLLSRVTKYHDPADDIHQRAYRHGFQTDSASEMEDSDDNRTKSVFERKSSQEQAVDELLHGKMWQCLFENRHRLSQTTLVLGSGDGAKSEFSPSGFLAPVEAALEAGAKVEIICFKSGCSNVWETLERRCPTKVQRIFLDDFMDELIE